MKTANLLKRRTPAPPPLAARPEARERGPQTAALAELPSVLCGPPWAHYLGGYQDQLLSGPLGLHDLRCTEPDGVKHKDYRGEVLS
jgi:hypothetical protein